MMFERNNKGKRDAMVVTSMEALRVSRPVRESRSSQAGTDTQRTSDQGLTLTQAEKMLSSLVAAGWFEMSKKGYYTLSPRTLIELRGWLIETYNDISEDEDSSENETLRVAKIKFCHACREIVTMVSHSNR